MQSEPLSTNIPSDRFADQGVQPIDPANLDVLNELMQREPIFHRPELGTMRQDFENMTVETFWEVGASGRRYSRKYVMDTLELRHSQPHEDPWETRDFHCLEIALDNYLITYTLIQGERVTRRFSKGDAPRTTIWQRCGADWKIVYHQGTVVENG